MAQTKKLERIRRCKALIEALDREIGSDYHFSDRNRLILGALKLLLEVVLEDMKSGSD